MPALTTHKTLAVAIIVITAGVPFCSSYEELKPKKSRYLKMFSFYYFNMETEINKHKNNIETHGAEP